MPEDTLIENQAAKPAKNDKLTFTFFPAYARFVKDDYLIPYIREQIYISRKINLPMLKFFQGVPDEDLIVMATESHREFLTAVEENRLEEQLEKSLDLWIKDRLGIIKRDEITAEDITLTGYMRKKALLKFLPAYTTDVTEALEIAKEIDTYTVESDTAATNIYIKLLRNRIHEQAFFTEVVSNTTPGLNYILDLPALQIRYANKNAIKFFGATLSEMKNMGSSVVTNMVHPDDVAVTMDGLTKCGLSADEEVTSWEFRLKSGDGTYIWMRNYSSVFKRNKQGIALEIVGIILDVENEKEIADKLLMREKQLLDAQAQAQLGSFELDVETGLLEVTPQFLEIYEVNELDLHSLTSRVHPADRDRVIANRDKAIAENSLYENEYRYLVNGREKILWSRGVLSYKNGRKVMTGTVMDVTNRNKMTRDLLESRDLYKQAQELSHIGNWTWNLQTDECTWSDELFRIYDIPPEPGNARPENWRGHSHADDVKMIDEQLQFVRDLHIPVSFNYRIVSPSGAVKYLHLKAEISRNDEGRAIAMFGTLQDITEKQQLIERLQESDGLFKQAQARTHIGNWTWDIQKNKVTWSDEMYRVYGLEPQSEEVNYETYISHIHPDDRETRVKQVQRVFETGEPEDHHYRIVLPDGSVRILHTKSELEYDKDGNPARMTGTCQDITEKQLLIDRLQNSEQLYKQAQAISHLGNWSWDMTTKAIEWSDEIYRIYELEPQSISSSFTLDLYNHPDDAILIKDSIKQALESNKPFDFNYRIILKSGKIKTLNAKGEFIGGQDNSHKIYGTLQDITEQKMVERQLKDYQEFIEKITDVTPSIIASYNIHTGKFSFINDAVEKFLGYPPSMVLKGGVEFMTSIIHPDDLPGILEKNATALEEANSLGNTNNEQVVEFKYRMKNNNGAYRWFHTYGTIFERNEKGLVDSILNISVDITEQEIAEQALFRKNLQLQQSNTSLEEYAYVASHDLKEPLRKIATFSDRILTSQMDTLNDDGKLFLNKIISSVSRMQSMINDLLSVSTILGNTAYEPCDLNLILADALLPLDHKIEENNAQIEADKLPTVAAVPSQFRQLFQNLINNSLKFGREGTPVHIKITHKALNAKGIEHYNLTKGKKYVQLEFEDNGIGFDNQYAGKIFAIFQRLHGKSEYEGTGIGLAICKKIVENHNGLIFAKGETGKGAVFTIIIPIN